MTLDETADFISEGLPAYQRDANLRFLFKVWDTLKDDKEGFTYLGDIDGHTNH